MSTASIDVPPCAAVTSLRNRTRMLARDASCWTRYRDMLCSRLLERAAGELVAGDAGREAEVVLDPRGCPRLAARRLTLDHDRRQAFRRPVDRGREAGRPGAHDHHVVGRVLGLGLEAEQLGDAA